MAEETHHGFGELLRRARETAGVEISDLAATTRIAARFIEALETEDWARVPGSVIGRGFVRVLARELRAAPGPLEEAYRLARGEPVTRRDHALPETDWKVALRSDRRRRPLWLAGGVLLVVLLLAAATWLGRAGSGGERVGTPAAPAAVEPQGSAARPPSPVELTGPHRLVVEAREQVWVRVQPDGGETRELSLEAGGRAEFGAERGLRLELGSAGSVQLFWNGVALRVPGAVGEQKTLEFPAAAVALQP